MAGRRPGHLRTGPWDVGCPADTYRSQPEACSGIEFSARLVVFDGSINITDNQVIWTATSTVQYGAGAFNGFVLNFVGAPLITSVTLSSRPPANKPFWI